MQRVKLDELHIQVIRVRGQHHALQGLPCQDAVVAIQTPKVIIATVCDGVGSVPLSHYGAEIAAREVTLIVQQAISLGVESLLNSGFLASLYLQVHDRLSRISEEVGLHPTQGVELFLSTTIQIAIITPEESIVLALGDGYVTWEGVTRSIETMIGRPKPAGIALPPPLIGTAIWHHAGGRAPKEDAPEWNRFLRKEAQGFYVVAFGSSRSVLQHGLELATDGLRFSDELVRPVANRGGFPLMTLLRQIDAARLTAFAELFNLCVASPGADVIKPEQRAEAFASLLQEHPELDQPLRDYLTARSTVIPSTVSAYIHAALTSQGDSLAAQEVLASTLARLLTEVGMQYIRDQLHISVSSELLPLWDDVGYVRIASR